MCDIRDSSASLRSAQNEGNSGECIVTTWSFTAPSAKPLSSVMLSPDEA